jgi:hypothetical protein
MPGRALRLVWAAHGSPTSPGAALNIAFVLIAEGYQAYHGAAVAFDLMARRGIRITFFYNDPETPHHLERLREAYGAPPLQCVRLHRPALARAMQSGSAFGLAKKVVLLANERQLEHFDAVVGLEDTLQLLFGDRPEHSRPRRILIDHGAGDRHVPSHRLRGRFDLMLCKGSKVVEQMERLGVARPGHIATTGHTKSDASRRLARPVAFAERRPVVLYNPHRTRGLSSWSRFIEPLLAAFAAQSDYNLIVAPHVKLMQRRPRMLRRYWERRSTPNIRIDTGSDFCCDNSYTAAADIYLGDVSSQVYEFVARPRPCVFLDASGAAWRHDRNFLFWHMGDVVQQPGQLMDAIRAAKARHHLYLGRQQWMAAHSLGDTGHDASRRAADLIQRYLRHGNIDAVAETPVRRSGPPRSRSCAAHPA